MRAVATLIALVLAGCGGGGEDPPGAAVTPERSGGSGAQAEEVIRGWSDAMRRGDIEAASARFAVPATVANGTPETELTSRAAVRRFNESLPCGSRVLATEPHHGLVIATFELTDRPGGDCGSGAGGEASAAFEIRNGLIVRWIRVPSGEELPPAGPVV